MFARCRQLYASLAYRLGGAAHGGGLPVPESALDAEYRNGHWDHFFSDDELRHNLLLVSHLHAVHRCPSILDVGCGSGRLPSLLAAESIAHYLGIDLSREGLRRARELPLSFTHFEHADFECWRPTRTWDVIVFNETLGYARHPARLALDYARWLAPGGAVVVSYFRSGNHAALWSQLEHSFRVIRADTACVEPDRVWDVKTLVPAK